MSAIIFQKPREIIGATNTPAANTKLILPMAPSGRCDKVTATSGWGVGAQTDGGPVHFVSIPCEDAETISLFWEWFDATTSVSAAVIQFTNQPSSILSDYDEVSNGWQTDTAISVTGPNGTAADAEGVNIANRGWRRARLRFVADAAGDMSFWTWGKD